MSFQAQAWAIKQTAGSPSAKATLWSIANYANEMWVAWPRQSLIADESEQSEDSVGKRVRDLAERGLLRRVKLKRGGRRTVDFLILPPSPLFAAGLDAMADYLPAGCIPVPENDPADAAASCGSVDAEKSAEENDISDATLPQVAGASEIPPGDGTLPQLAAHAPATVREQNEPLYEPRVSPQTPLVPGETQKESGLPKEAEASEPIGFSAFWTQYPDHETDNRRKAAAAFVALSESDRRAAGERVSRYATQIAQTGRRPVGAWRWLQERRFSEYAPGAATTRAQRWFVPEASDPWNAACALGAVLFQTNLRMPQFWCVKGPDGIAGASVPIEFMGNWQPWLVPWAEWIFVEEGTPQYRRWVARIGEICERSPIRRVAGRIDTEHLRSRRLFGREGTVWAERDYHGLLVPLEWPPGRTPRAASTGPPPVEHSDADSHELQNL